MAVSLATAQKLSQDRLVKGIIEEVRKASPLLERLSFMNVTGNALKVVRESDTMGSAGFLGANDIITSTEADFNTDTFSLYLAVTQADVPNMYRAQMSDFNDQMKAQVRIKSKKLAWLVERQLFYGDAGTSNGFDGLNAIVTDWYTTDGFTARPRHFVMANAGKSALTILKLDEVIDSFTGGDPDVMIMSKQMRRRMASYLRTVSQIEDMGRDTWGNYMEGYRNIPILVSDQITDTEAYAAAVGTVSTSPLGSDSTSIYFIRFGEGDGFVGLQNGGIKTEYFETLEDKDASRVRMKWYVGVAPYSTDCVAVLNNIDPAAAVVSGL